MMAFDYRKRITTRNALLHPWFKNAPTTKISDKVMLETLNNLRTFQATEKLQQATMSMMV